MSDARGTAPERAKLVLVSLVLVAVGMALVFRFFPRKDAEEALRASYHSADLATAGSEPGRASA